MLAQGIDTQYSTAVGPNQVGATKGRGTTQASHIIRSSMDMCRLLNLSCAVLFVDLSKAFDKAIREIALGLPSGSETPMCEKLGEVGLMPEFAARLSEWIAVHGTLFQQLGVDPAVSDLIKSMHNGAWIAIDGDDKIVVSKTGRQGCKLGALFLT